MNISLSLTEFHVIDGAIHVCIDWNECVGGWVSGSLYYIFDNDEIVKEKNKVMVEMRTKVNEWSRINKLHRRSSLSSTHKITMRTDIEDDRDECSWFLYRWKREKKSKKKENRKCSFFCSIKFDYACLYKTMMTTRKTKQGRANQWFIFSPGICISTRNKNEEKPSNLIVSNEFDRCNNKIIRLLFKTRSERWVSTSLIHWFINSLIHSSSIESLSLKII